MKRLVLASLSPLLIFSKGVAIFVAIVVVIFAGGLGAGCGGNPDSEPGVVFDACAPLAIIVDATLTDGQSLGVTDGMAMWNRLAGTSLTSTADPDSAGAARVPLVFQSAAPPFHGFFDAQVGMVFINQDLTAIDPLRITIAHELGHVFGLPHVDRSVRLSLMNSGNTTVEATPEDAAALAARWGACPR